jgi:hypothetical protein
MLRLGMLHTNVIVDQGAFNHIRMGRTLPKPPNPKSFSSASNPKFLTHASTAKYFTMNPLQTHQTFKSFTNTSKLKMFILRVKVI